MAYKKKDISAFAEKKKSRNAEVHQRIILKLFNTSETFRASAQQLTKVLLMNTARIQDKHKQKFLFIYMYENKQVI